MKSYPCAILQNSVVSFLFCLAFVAGMVFIIIYTGDLHNDIGDVLSGYWIACIVS